MESLALGPATFSAGQVRQSTTEYSDADTQPSYRICNHRENRAGCSPKSPNYEFLFHNESPSIDDEWSLSSSLDTSIDPN